MRRKVSKLLLVLLVLCLVGCMVAMVACGKKGDKTDYSKPSSTMLKEVIAYLGNSFAPGESFGIDIAAGFAIKDKKDSAKDVKFNLTARGNINAAETAAETDNNFVIELVKESGGNKDVVLGIAYEVIENNPYFFINLMDGGYQKIDGYSIKALLSLLKSDDKNSNVDADTAAEDISVDTLMDTITQILFEEKGTVKDGVYTFNFSLVNTIKKAKDAMSMLTGIIGMSEADLVDLIKVVCGDLEYANPDGSKTPVVNFTGLLNYVRQSFPLQGTIALKFANEKFVSANANFDFAKQASRNDTYSLSLDRVFVGTVDTAIPAFDGFALTAEERAEATAYNMLNFQLLGQANGIKNGNVVTTYDITINSDLNPLALLNLIGDTSSTNIVACLKELGYFSFTVDEVTPGKEGNILTIFSNFADGYAVLQLKGYDMPLTFGLGGVYEFESLVSVMGNMFNSGATTAAEEEAGLDIMGLLKQVIGFFSTDNITTDGLNLNMAGVNDMLADMLGLEGALSGAIGLLLNAQNAPTLNFKLQTPTFGDCDSSMTAADIISRIRTNPNLTKEGYTDTIIKEITSIDNLPTVIDADIQDYNTLFKYDTNKVFSKAFFDVTGKDLQNNTVKSNAFIYSVSGIDPKKAGEQEVTFYLGIYADIFGLLNESMGLGMSIKDSQALPLFGTLKYTTTVTVRPYNADANVDVKRISILGMAQAMPNVTNTRMLAVPSNESKSTKIWNTFVGMTAMYIDVQMAVTIDGTTVNYYLKQEALQIFDSTGADVSKNEAYYGGDAMRKSGDYTLQLASGKYTWEKEIQVDEIQVVRADGMENQTKVMLGGTFYTDYKVFEILSDGTKNELTITKTALNNITASNYILNDDGSYTIKKDLGLIGKKPNFTFTAKPTNFAATQASSPSVEIEADGLSIKQESNAFLSNQTFNKNITAVVDGVTYYNIYDATEGKMLFIDAEGNKLAGDYSIVFKWHVSPYNEIAFSANGVPSNTPYKNGSNGITVRLNVAIGEYTFESSPSVSVLKAEDNATKRKIKLTDYLDGKLLNVDKVLFVNASGDVQALEFKYGAAGYGIYIKNTDTKVYDVAVSAIVKADSSEYTLTDGKFADIGTYTVTYKVTLDDQVLQTLYHDITVEA